MGFVFLICCGLSLYPYVIYPLVLFGLCRLWGSGWEKGERALSFSIIISVYNEEEIIEQKVQNAFLLDYPEGHFEVVVVSDGSTDHTLEILSRIHDPRLVVRAYAERSGKTACLNRAIPETDGEILLFTDANSMFPSDLLRRISMNFCDENVGLVTGWTRYQSAEGSAKTTGIYSLLEKRLKQMESQLSSCAGADGAVFAMRKSLYRPLKADDINDFVLPLRVVEQGFRAVMDPAMYIIEQSGKDSASEFHRQVRITNRTIRALLSNAHMFNPLRFGSFSFFLISHKLLRFLVPFFIIGAMASATALALEFSCSVFLLALTGVAVLILGAVIHKNNRFISLIRMLLIMLAAQLVGWWHVLIGRKFLTWTPQR